MKRITHTAIAIVLYMLFVPSYIYGRNRIHIIEELNHTPHARNSHAGCEHRSSLELEFESKRVITNEELNSQGPAIYTRIKQMKNGQWLLLFQGHRIGSYIYYCLSSDLNSWSYRKSLFQPYAVTTPLGEDQRRFSTADAVVLHNGDILVACSYRAHLGYKNNVGCGIMLRRSCDNGLSWSKEQVIYEGTNWEPYLLQLPDGRIQCYFTDNDPALKDSGTSMIISYDNGASWGEKVVVCRQHRYTYDDGTRIYTDQMPCFHLLNDGQTLLGFMESALHHPNSDDKDYRMSLVRQHGLDWTPLTGEEVGPSDRDSNITRGAGGYVTTFSSGETVISCNIGSKFSLKVGNHTGERFNGSSWDSDWLQPFFGYWGSTETIGPHRLLATIHGKKGIQYATLHLNHDIYAHNAKIKADGRSDEWKHDDALFIGSKSPAQMTIRAACNESMLYLIFECISNDKGALIKLRFDNNPTSQIIITNKETIGKLPNMEVYRRKGRTEDGREGFIVEMAIPLSRLRIDRSKGIGVWCALVSNNTLDTFSFINEKEPATWPRIVF